LIAVRLRVKNVDREFPTPLSLHRKLLVPAAMFPGLIGEIQDSPGIVAQEVAQSCR
jgi:hypothetical protein